MLLNEPAVLEVLTFKVDNIDDQIKLWWNIHHFMMPEGFAIANVHQTMHQAVLAEQFLHVQDVRIPFVVAYPLTAFHALGFPTDCYSWICDRACGYSVFPGERATDYEVGFIMKKVLNVGRNGRLMFRRALKNTDINISHDERIYHSGSDEITSVRERFFTEHMSQSYYPAVSITRAENFGAVESWREVQRFAVGHAIVTRSIEDAQDRKTFIALSYKKTAHESYSFLIQMQARYEELCAYPLEEIEVEYVISFLPLVASSLGALESVQLYWTEGVKPHLAAEWRPISGLDPFSHIGNAACGNAIERCSFMIEEMNALMAQYQAKIPVWELKQRKYINWEILTSYAQMLMVERWTGTPLPIDLDAGGVV